MKTWVLAVTILAGSCVNGAASAQDVSDKSVATVTGETTNADDADRQVIAQLKAQGSDITKPTDVIFYLYFHTQGQAETLRAQIASMGFTVTIQPNDNPPAWALVANKTLVPNEDTILYLSHTFTTLAASQSGFYDGWEAALVK
jgi:hypothetical protein